MHIIITAGATRERIDDVRFISNRSTGKMGYKLAESAVKNGHQVTLISGVSSLPAVPGAEMVYIESAAEMTTAVKSRFAACDLLIMAAAVADYRPKTAITGKLKKTSGDLVLELERTEDILLSLAPLKRSGQLVVGFAAEAENVAAYAVDKLKRKNLDWIAANNIAAPNCGFGVDTNQITLFAADGRIVELPFGTKSELADKILNIVIGE